MPAASPQEGEFNDYKIPINKKINTRKENLVFSPLGYNLMGEIRSIFMAQP